MEQSQPGSANPETAAGDAGMLLQRATAQSTMLRRAFQLCASRRSDCDEWKLLEEAAAAFLERHPSGSPESEAQWYAVADRMLMHKISELLKRMAPHSDRARQFRRAAENAGNKASDGSMILGEAPAGRLRHAGLVWMALWHAADMQSVTAEQARKCLFHALNVTPSPSSGADTGARRWYEATGRLAASLLKRA